MYSDLLPLMGLIILSGFFSGSETALVSVSHSKVAELVSEKKANAKLLKKLKSDPHKLLITVLIGNNLVNIGASAYAAVVFTDLFGHNGVGIATGVMTFFILVFGEITPKSFAHEHAAIISLWVARPIYALQVILYPIVWMFEQIVKLVGAWVGSKKNYTVTEGELVAMLKIGAQEGAFESHEKELIENVLEFNDIEVEDVMTPRVSIEALSMETSLKEAVNYVLKHTHTRLPVYEENVDNIVGIISVKDILKNYHHYSMNKKLKNLKLAKPLEVPKSKKINKLFREFQRKHVHIAIVIDEFGGTAGLVTLEDLLEEIVGEIVDESDRKESPIEVIDEDTIEVDGGTEVEYINDYFKLKFGPYDHDTLNTLVTEHLHRFPREGEMVLFPRGQVIILKMDDNIIKKARIVRKKSSNKK